MSYREVANALGVNNSPLIAAWVRKSRNDGIEELSKPRERPYIMIKKEKNIKKKASKITIEESKRIKILEKQVRSLQIKNAFLKELRKLRKQEVQQKHKNQSQESSIASEDHLN